MFLKKLWFFSVCGLLCIYNLYDTLYNDSRRVGYVNNEKEKPKINFSLCIQLNEDLLEIFKRKSKNEYLFTVKQLIKHTCQSFFNKKTCDETIFLNESYIYNYHCCLSIDIKQIDLLIRNLTSVKYVIFAYFHGQSEIYFFLNLFYDRGERVPFDLHVIFYRLDLLEKPYETGCFKYTNENVGLKTKERLFSRASCLIECFKTRSRSLSYYYSTRDFENLTVCPHELNKINQFDWKTIGLSNRKDEDDCRKICMHKSCEVIFNLNKWTNNEEHKTYNLTYSVHSYTARPSFFKLYIIFTFLSLISLFLNVSVYRTSLKLIRKVLLNIFKRNNKAFKEFYRAIKLITLIISFLCLVGLSLLQILQFCKKDLDQRETFDFPNTIIPFQIVVCIPVQILIGTTRKLDERAEIDLLKKRSFEELEKLTSFETFQRGIQKISTKHGSRKRPVSYSINRNVTIFRGYYYEIANQTGSNFLTRCFRIDFKIEELRYERLFSLSMLEIKIDFDWYIIFPLDLKQNLHFTCPYLVDDPYLFKLTVSRKFNCRKYHLEKNCRSRNDCIGQKINQIYFDRYGNLSVQSIVYKDAISTNGSFKDVYFDRNLNEEIVNESKASFSEPGCISTFFFIEKKKLENLRKKRVEMHLYYQDILIADNPVMSLSDLFFNYLMSFQLIFFGLNINEILLVVFMLLKKYKFQKVLKIFKHAKLIICFVGLTIHLYFVVYETLTEDLVKIQGFAYAKNVPLPNLAFCFLFREKIDPNNKLTFSYLDDLTKDLNLSFFKNISFLDENYDEKFYRPAVEQSETNKEVNVGSFYYQNFKCFEFSFKRIENNRFLYMLINMNFVSIKFNKRIIQKYYNDTSGFKFYFVNKKENTSELNSIHKVDFKHRKEINPMVSFNQKMFIIKVEDRLKYLKQPLSIFYESVNLDDTTEYIRKVEKDLDKFKLKTRLIPHYKNEKENLEIDDRLFLQYIYQIKNVSDHNSFRIINYERRFIFDSKFVKAFNFSGYYDVHFLLSPFQTYLVAKNRNTFSKFLINCLNSLGFWFSFSIPDIHLVFQKLFSLIFNSYKFFVRMKIKLERKRNSSLFR